MKTAMSILVLVAAGCAAPAKHAASVTPSAAAETTQSAAPRADAPAAPQGLTAWRTSQGVFLSWSASRSGSVAVWRGEEGEEPRMFLNLPSGQAGFLDLGAKREKSYVYGIGSERVAAERVTVPGAGARGRILPSLVTTCSGLVQGRAFPGNTQNYFQIGKDVHVQYFGYFILKPYDPAEREVRLVWRDPDGKIFSEYSHGVTPRKADFPEGTLGHVVITQAIGLKEALPQNGQVRIPDKPGLYTVETFFDGEPAAQTVFFLVQPSQAGQPGGGTAR